MKKKRSSKKPSAPPQITLGGEIGKKVWSKYVLPLIKKQDLSTRDIAAMLGVSHNTVAIWRRAYA